MKENKKSLKSVYMLCIIGMLSAVSFVLFLFEFPVIPSLGHLKLDFSDVPAMVSGVLFGPVSAVVVELIKNLIGGEEKSKRHHKNKATQEEYDVFQ